MNRNSFSPIRACAVAATMVLLCGSVSSASPLKDAMLLHMDCDTLTAPADGVTISGTVRLADEGKFGKSILIERRTLNLVPNGDFKAESMDGWFIEGPAARSLKGGVENAPCLNIKTGANIALPFTNQKAKTPYAFSFYAKAVGAGKITVSAKTGGSTVQIGEFDAPADGYRRFTAAFTPAEDSFTLRIKVDGEVLLSHVQLESGSTWASTFCTPLNMRGVSVINVPADGRYMDINQGAMSCWIDVPWMDSKAGGVAAILGVGWKNPDYTGWGAFDVMGTSSSPNVCYLLMVDRQKRVAAVSFAPEQVKPAKWHNLVYNWKFENNQLTLEIYVDGTAFHTVKTMPFGPMKPVEEITVGYRGGAYLDGKLDDFALFKRPLTKDEVMQIYSSGKPLAEL